MDRKPGVRRPRAVAAASATVEAAVVMGAAMLILMAVLFTGFYLHDKCILIGAAHETAQVAAERERMEDSRPAEAYFRERAAGKLLYFASASCSVTAAGDMVYVRASARSGRMAVSVSAAAPLTRPEDKIREENKGGI